MLPAFYLSQMTHFSGWVHLPPLLNTPNGTIVKIVSFSLS